MEALLIDPVLAPLLEMGSTGVFLAFALTAYKLHEARSAKKNGGTVYTRVTILEEQVSDMKETVASMENKLDSFHGDFLSFREEVRLTWARQQAKEEVLREVRNEVGN